MATSEHKHNLSKSEAKAIEAFQKAQVRQAEESKKRQNNYAITRASLNTVGDLVSKGGTAALARALYTGVKLANAPEQSFYNELVSPLNLVSALKLLGHEALIWSPETLCAVIDSKYGGWTKDRVTKALETFHATGELDTKIPDLVRQKIYALRLVITSDSAHSFWENFEKVGCVFNDRLANFSVVQALSAAECARTLAIVQNIRPDQYSKEVKIYIAACCHQDGLYTVGPSKWLHTFNGELQEFNESTSGSKEDPKITEVIRDLYTKYKKTAPASLEDSTEAIQAAKLLGIDEYANEALLG